MLISFKMKVFHYCKMWYLLDLIWIHILSGPDTYNIWGDGKFLSIFVADLRANLDDYILEEQTKCCQIFVIINS